MSEIKLEADGTKILTSSLPERQAEALQTAKELFEFKPAAEINEDLRELMDDYFLNDHGQTDRRRQLYQTFSQLQNVILSLQDLVIE